MLPAADVMRVTVSPPRWGDRGNLGPVIDIDEVWPRIERHAGQPFHTITDLQFTYWVPGAYLRITRDGREINRSLSRTNFARALEAMPADRPSDIKDRQGSAYTWAVLMDDRIRAADW